MSVDDIAVVEASLHLGPSLRDVPRKCACHVFKQRRYHHAVLVFFNFCFLYLLRLNLNVAIVAMTASRYPVTLPNSTITYIHEFNWDTIERGKILSSFFYGYASTQILGGWLGGRFGGVRVFGISFAFSSFFTLFIPLMARAGVYPLIGLRVVIGLFEGVTLPSMVSIWAHWAPPNERTLLVVGAMTGVDIGKSLGTFLCGIISQNFGWSATFYVTGTVAFLWSCIWMVFARERPEHDPWITQEELAYLKCSISLPINRKLDYPVKEILKSPPVHALFFASICEAWSLHSVMTQMPIFLSDVYNFDVQKAGLFVAIPYAVSMFLSPVSAYFVDLIFRKNIFTLTQVRKLALCGGSLGQSFCMLIIAFSNSSNMSIILLTINTCMNSPVYSTIDVNYLDLAPQYAGLLMGVTNTFVAGTGLVSSTVYGYIITNKTLAEWRIVFLITSGIYLIGAVVYGLFGSAVKQPWAPDSEKIDEKFESIRLTSQASKYEENLTT